MLPALHAGSYADHWVHTGGLLYRLGLVRFGKVQ